MRAIAGSKPHVLSHPLVHRCAYLYAALILGEGRPTGTIIPAVSSHTNYIPPCRSPALQDQLTAVIRTVDSHWYILLQKGGATVSCADRCAKHEIASRFLDISKSFHASSFFSFGFHCPLQPWLITVIVCTTPGSQIVIAHAPKGFGGTWLCGCPMSLLNHGLKRNPLTTYCGQSLVKWYGHADVLPSCPVFSDMQFGPIQP